MPKDLLQIILKSAGDSFIQVTVFVGAVLLLFGYINFRQQGAFVERIEKSKRYQPLIGAFLGMTPGCGGAIFVMPLYVKGTVSFGTVVATLIATAGDSAFVTLTKAPKDFVIVTSISFVVGAITGYIIDHYNIGDWVRKRSRRLSKIDVEREHKHAEAMMDELYCDNPNACRSNTLRHIGHEEGDEVDLALHHSKPLDVTSLGYRVTHGAYVVFWIILAAGFILGILDLAMVDINALPGLPNLGLIIGLLGTIATVLYMIFSKKFIKATSHEEVEHKLFSLKETFIHNAEETAFVGTWVFAAYLAYELGVFAIGGEHVIEAALTSTGLTAVLIGAAVGLIPGCGPQIIFVSLYLKGMFPFAALLANAISQDGDALFALIALDPKSAFWSTVYNTIPALIVGILAYYIQLAL
ncbi:MAG TPA: putative manganese transporter [Clostridia bacterium]|nr:putative manganese transporter [Clostridia bacterium]